MELDLHAHAVAKRLRERFSCTAHVIAVDIAATSGSYLSTTTDGGVINDYAGNDVHVRDLDVLWWRRANQPQAVHPSLSDPTTFEFVSREWRFAFQGLFFADFGGVWVNDPASDARATSKIAQLRTAASVGFKIPDTIITNQPSRLREFFHAHNGKIIAKKIVGTPLRPLATVELLPQHLVDQNVQLCPAVYQEKIDADLHLRVVCFGREVHAISIKSDVLDWRRDLNSEMRVYNLPADVSNQVQSVIALLGLRMGVLDLILDNEDRYVFLEVNTQGQFLFAEHLAGVDLTEHCARYLAQVVPVST